MQNSAITPISFTGSYASPQGRVGGPSIGRSGSGRRAKHAAVTNGKAEGASSATKTASIVSVTHFLPQSGGRSGGGSGVPLAAVASNCCVSSPAPNRRIIPAAIGWFAVVSRSFPVSRFGVSCLVRRFCRFVPRQHRGLALLRYRPLPDLFHHIRPVARQSAGSNKPGKLRGNFYPAFQSGLYSNRASSFQPPYIGPLLARRPACAPPCPSPPAARPFPLSCLDGSAPVRRPESIAIRAKAPRYLPQADAAQRPELTACRHTAQPAALPPESPQ